MTGHTGECLCCGHIHTLAVWRDGTNIGVCQACRDAAVSLRGPCSAERGCLCQQGAAVPGLRIVR